MLGGRPSAAEHIAHSAKSARNSGGVRRSPPEFAGRSADLVFHPPEKHIAKNSLDLVFHQKSFNGLTATKAFPHNSIFNVGGACHIFYHPSVAVNPMTIYESHFGNCTR